MRKYKYSDDIVNVVKLFLTEDEWHYSFDEDYGIFKFGLRLGSRIQNISYVIDAHDAELVIYGICPVSADWEDPDMMARMAEFICRANYGLKNGCFELDFRDGEIRYKSYIDCDNQLPSTVVVRNSVHCTAAMIRRYAQGIVDIIFGESIAKDAIAKCEKSTNRDIHLAEDVRPALEEALGENVREETNSALLAHFVSELGTTEDGQKDEDRPEDIRLDPFADGGGASVDQSHIRRGLFAQEGGDAC